MGWVQLHDKEASEQQIPILLLYPKSMFGGLDTLQFCETPLRLLVHVGCRNKYPLGCRQVLHSLLQLRVLQPGCHFLESGRLLGHEFCCKLDDDRRITAGEVLIRNQRVAVTVDGIECTDHIRQYPDRSCTDINQPPVKWHVLPGKRIQLLGEAPSQTFLYWQG